MILIFWNLMYIKYYFLPFNNAVVDASFTLEFGCCLVGSLSSKLM